MLSDNDLINLMISEPSWEDVIVKIVAEEGMDPWAVDICALADVFSTYLAKMDQLDLRVPARFILITAILLRMKSDILAEKKQRILIPESTSVAKDEELMRTLAALPPLQPPLKRVPLGTVTMNELITALRKAFEVQERRERRKLKIRAIVERAVPAGDTDITKRIENLLAAINQAIDELHHDVEFSKLVNRWERAEIVRALIPLLHLSQDGKVRVKQEELFKEILVELRRKDSNATIQKGAA
ncbi:MAG: segregation/condensation protein A [Candidatus Aenigmatarchaeota archaeon]|nr:segregation/condensation protein A [Candidatus Aenigmarchaeota archaeon]